jgi:hypothetical protein
VVLYTGGPRLETYALSVRDSIGSGNGDGVLEAGEDAAVRVTLRNRGGGTASVLGSLAALDASGTVTAAASSFGEMSPGEIQSGDAWFHVHVDAADPAPRFLLTAAPLRGDTLRTALDLVPPEPPSNLLAEGAVSSIRLTWTKSGSPDLRGYVVYRSDGPSGPWTRRNDYAIGRAATYEDEGLASLTAYHYRVAAEDSSGNASAPSGVLKASTTLATQPGFPVPAIRDTPASPAVAEMDGLPGLEIVTGAEEIYALHADGSELVDGDNVTVNLGPFSGTGAPGYWASPALDDLDGDGVIDVVAVSWKSDPLEPGSVKLFVWDAGGVLRDGFPLDVNLPPTPEANPWGTPAVADLDGDGEREIVVSSGSRLYAFHADGTELVDGDLNPGTAGVLHVLGSLYNYGSPAIGDLDGNGSKEILYGARDGKLYGFSSTGTPLPGFPFRASGEITSSVALGDLTGDGRLEIVFGAVGDTCYALQDDLTPVPGWPKRIQLNQDFNSSPALADMDGDGLLDVAIGAGSGGRLYLFKGSTGALLPGFPVQMLNASGLAEAVQGSPSIGDVDGDGQVDVLIGTEGNRLWAWKLNGTVASGFPIHVQGEIRGAPLLWDVDQDGFTEIAFQSIDQNIYLFRTPTVFDPARYPWPMWRHDSARTGFAGSPVYTPVGASLAGFAATSTPAGIELAWTLVGDVGSIARLDLYRAGSTGDDGPPGPPERMNAAPLPVEGRDAGRFLDAGVAPGVRYHYHLEAVDRTGDRTRFATLVVAHEPEASRKGIRIHPAYPNPFRTGTTIAVEVPRAGSSPGDSRKTRVSVRIFDVTGRRIADLFTGEVESGTRAFVWDGRTGEGTEAAPGIYFVRVRAGDVEVARKVIRGR